MSIHGRRIRRARLIGAVCFMSNLTQRNLISAVLCRRATSRFNRGLHFPQRLRYPVHPLLCRCRARDQIQIFHNLPNRRPQLMYVNNSGERSALSAELVSNGKQIRVLRNENPTEFGRSHQ